MGGFVRSPIGPTEQLSGTCHWTPPRVNRAEGKRDRSTGSSCQGLLSSTVLDFCDHRMLRIWRLRGGLLDCTNHCPKGFIFDLLAFREVPFESQ